MVKGNALYAVGATGIVALCRRDDRPGSLCLCIGFTKNRWAMKLLNRGCQGVLDPRLREDDITERLTP